MCNERRAGPGTYENMPDLNGKIDLRFILSGRTNVAYAPIGCIYCRCQCLLYGLLQYRGGSCNITSSMEKRKQCFKRQNRSNSFSKLRRLLIFTNTKQRNVNFTDGSGIPIKNW